MVSYLEVHEWMALANLVIFVAVLSMLIVLSFFLQKKRNFVWHGNLMLVVVIIAGLLTVAHMGPSLWWTISEAIKGFNIVAITGIVHGVIGLAALSIGIWLVGVWAYNQSGETRFCASKKKLMRKILTLWIMALVLGLLYYSLHLTWG